MANNIMLRFPEGKPKALTLSYDDGVEQDIRLLSIMKQFGLKGTFNLNSGLYAPEGKVYAPGTIHRRMTKDKVTEVFADSGMEVAVHGYTHPFLDELPVERVTYEVMKDRLTLEEQFGCIVRGMAYPYGTFNDSVVEALRSCGIVYSRTTVSTEKFLLPKDWLRMPATCHHNNPRLMELAEKFVSMTVRNHPQLFYLWGHSYEFEEHNNWDVIEKFAAYIAGKEDIWYATNMEIYEYVTDFQRLITSADGNTLYNPTCRTLWAKGPSGTFSIAPGETLTLG